MLKFYEIFIHRFEAIHYRIVISNEVATLHLIDPIQLIDNESAVHVWADRYDREIDDIFQLQDEIALRVASELQGELTEGEMARIRGGGTSNLDAWVEQMRAVAGTRLVTRESYAEARRSAERAIQIDPDYAAPRCILSFICRLLC